MVYRTITKNLQNPLAFIDDNLLETKPEEMMNYRKSKGLI